MKIIHALTVLAFLSGAAAAQQGVDHNHPAPQPPQGPAPKATQPMAPGQPPAPHGQQAPMQMPMQMPEQCRAMMQAMPAGCMSMMQGRMMPGGMPGPAAAQGAGSPATQGYEAAMHKMDGPMMAGIRDADPDAAFVKGMIPHHQAAIDMANVVLQHGKDAQVRKWAGDVIREQQREIAEMEQWLKSRAK